MKKLILWAGLLFTMGNTLAFANGIESISKISCFYGQSVIYEVKDVYLSQNNGAKVCQIGPRPRQAGDFHLIHCSDFDAAEGDLFKVVVETLEYYNGMSKAPLYQEVITKICGKIEN